jgi:protein-S-isoprenylcysteine O-methyltransferase Ste14
VTSDTAASAIRVAWITFGLFWLASARRLKKTERAESHTSLAIRTVGSLAAVLFAFVPWGGLANPLVPRTQMLLVVSVVLAWAGVLFAIWARVILGRNWSATVTLKQSHDLIQSGPYRWVRHPIYSGMLLSFIGVILFLDRVGGVVGLVIAIAVYYLKARQEETIMAGHFGQAWEQYRSRTRAIIPFIL